MGNYLLQPFHLNHLKNPFPNLDKLLLLNYDISFYLFKMKSGELIAEWLTECKHLVFPRKNPVYQRAVLINRVLYTAKYKQDDCDCGEDTNDISEKSNL